MAVSLTKDGVQVVFDNSANSKMQNEAEKRKYSHLLTDGGLNNDKNNGNPAVPVYMRG